MRETVINQLIDFLKADDKDFIQTILEICLVVFDYQANQITEHNLTMFLHSLFTLADNSSLLSACLPSFLSSLRQSLSPQLHHTLLAEFISIYQSNHNSRVFVLEGVSSLIGIEGDLINESLIDSLLSSLIDPSPILRDTAERTFFLIAVSSPSRIASWIQQLLSTLQTQIQVVELAQDLSVASPLPSYI